MTKSLEGKSIIVTGAGRGNRQGNRPALRGRGGKGRGQRSRRRRRTARDRAPRPPRSGRGIKQRGGTRWRIRDRRRSQFPPARSSRWRRQLRQLDGVVNNAGILRERDLPSHEHRRLRIRHQGAFDGSFYVSHAAARLFRRTGERLRSSTSPRPPAGRQFRPGQRTAPRNSASSACRNRSRAT